MKKINFKKIEKLLEDILDSKTKVIDLIAENGDKRNLPDYLFENIEICNSFFVASKATIFIGLYAEVIKEITGIDLDVIKKNINDDIVLSIDTVDDLIIDIGLFIINHNDDDCIIKKYKSHSVSVFDLKNILKWFEVCKNNNLKVHII